MLAMLSAQCGNRLGKPDLFDAETTGHIFLSNENDLMDGVLKTIYEESGARMGGYILIVPVGIDGTHNRIEYLLKRIRVTYPNAVHLLDLNGEEDLLPSQRITVEGAAIIFFIGGGLNRFMSQTGADQLSDAVRKAHEKGATLVGLNNSCGLFGEKYLREKQNVQESVADTNWAVRLNNGLNVLPGVIIDVNSAADSAGLSGPIRSCVDSLDYSFVGIFTEGLALIRESTVTNLGNSRLLIRDGNSREWETLESRGTRKLQRLQ